MRLRTQRTYLLLLLFTFILVDVSESIAFAPAIGLLIRSRQIPLFLRRISTSKWVSSIWNKLKSLFNNVLKIGDIVSGISDVKDYLEIFGYLNLPSKSNFTDKFTVNLQSAIAEFQKNFNLDVTEQLDENTYQILSQPRCGVPDIINGTNTMNSNSVNQTTSFKPWWRTGENEKELTLTYAFHPQNNVTDSVKSLFKDAFNKWTNVTALKFNETTSFNGSNITIAFVRIDGKGAIVGGVDMNYSINVGRIYLDSEEEWVLSNEIVGEDGDVDLESVVMHEIGHLLGLGHSSVEVAVMYPIVLPEKKTELVDDDDLQRIQQIYGLT